MFPNQTESDVNEGLDYQGNHPSLETSSASPSGSTATAPVFTFSGSSGTQPTNTSWRTVLGSLFLEPQPLAHSTPRGPTTNAWGVLGAPVPATSDTSGYARSMNPSTLGLGSLTSGFDVVFFPTASTALNHSAPSSGFGGLCAYGRLPLGSFTPSSLAEPGQADFADSIDSSFGRYYGTYYDSTVNTIGEMDEHQSEANVSNPAGTNTSEFTVHEPFFPTFYGAMSTAAASTSVAGLGEHQPYATISDPTPTNTGDFTLQEPVLPTSFGATSTTTSTSDNIGAFSGAAGSGTSVAKYVPVRGFEKVSRPFIWPYGTHSKIHTRLHCIAAMNAYQGESPEELRLEDYVAGRKGNRYSDLATSEMASLVQSIEEVWRCPVCLDRVSAPVKMCENGHISCAKCNRQPRCPLCRARFSLVPTRVLEQVLDLLPKKCRHAQFGCGTLHPLDLMQYCVYRTMRCFGPCSWEGPVKDWWEHARAEHQTFDVSQPITITHLPYSQEFYCLKSDEDLFLFRIHAENGLAHCSARFIPTAEPKHRFVFEVTIKKEGLLRSAVIKASKDLFDIHRMSVLSHEIYFTDIVIALQRNSV